MPAETTIGVSSDQKELVNSARSELESELGITLSQADTVEKLARDFLNEDDTQ